MTPPSKRSQSKTTTSGPTPALAPSANPGHFPAPLKWILILVALIGAVWGISRITASSEKKDAAALEQEQASRPVFAGISSHPDQNTIPISMQCGACHEKIFREWSDSDHAWAHRGLSPKLDAEPFHGLPLTAHGTTITFTTNAEGKRVLVDKTTNQTWTAEMAIGRIPLVQYLIPGKDGGYHTTSAAWDVSKREWFDMFGKDERRPGDWGHWTGRGMVWNTQCAWCHMSDFRKNYDTGTHTYHSAWKEPGITCIQCHNPLLEKPEQGTGCMIDTKKKFSIKQQADNCASCHARRDELDNEFRIGDNFEDHFHLSTPSQPGLFWPNGMQRDEVYTETGLKHSRMGKAGIQCLDCHDPHTAKLKLPIEDNSLCLKCHGTGERKAPIIDPQKHSHHKPDSTGNRCVECHMPETSYMARDPRRDHAMASPDPTLSRELGMPNACIMCHKDKNNEWAEKYVREWYGELPLTAHRDRSRAVHKAHGGHQDAFPELLSSLEKEENTYWRATLLELMSLWSTDPLVQEKARKSVKSANPLERAAAARILGETKSREVVPLLSDPSKIVRIQAAWALRDMLPANNAAMKELEAASLHQADQPGGAMKLAQIYTARANLAQTPQEAAEWNKKAEQWFRKAGEWDPNSPVVHSDYAIFLAAQNRPEEALQELEKSIALDDKNARMFYMLGLARTEAGDAKGAIKALDKAIELDPDFVQALYNRALMRNGQGDLNGACQDMDAAAAKQPDNPELPYTKSILLYQAGKKTEAAQSIQKLLNLFPTYQPALQLQQQLSSES